MTNSCSTFYISHPISVRHGQLGFPNRKQIIDYFLDLKDKGQYIPAEEDRGWKTDWEIHLDHRILDPLLDMIHLWYCKHIVGPRGPYFIVKDNFQSTEKFNIDANVWFQEYLPGQVSPQHEHGALSKHSWVYYLDVGENGSPLTFVQLEDNKNELQKVDEIHLPVYNDMIVMFPSIVHHKVYASQTKRYVLAGNINDISYEDKG